MRTGDRQVEDPVVEKIEALPEQIALEILFEDDDLLVLNKPAGMVMHPGRVNQQHTLVNALLAHCPNLSGIGGKERPGIVHRLDKETSGCLVVAKNDFDPSRSLQAIRRSHHAKNLSRARRGTFEKIERSDRLAIARHPVHRQEMSIARRRGRAAKTEYRVVRAGAGMSLVECTLHSGRTHQIRVHLHHLGHPVLGDKLYGCKHGEDISAPNAARVATRLHAIRARAGNGHSKRRCRPDFAEALRQIPRNVGRSPRRALD